MEGIPSGRTLAAAGPKLNEPEIEVEAEAELSRSKWPRLAPKVWGGRAKRFPCGMGLGAGAANNPDGARAGPGGNALVCEKVPAPRVGACCAGR